MVAVLINAPCMALECVKPTCRSGVFLFVCTLYVKTMLTFSTGYNNMYMRACNYLDLVLPLQLSRDHGLLLFPITKVGVPADKTFTKQSCP